MTEQEIINNRLETKIAIQDEKFNAVIAKIDATNSRIDDFVSEMRNKDNQRHAEMSEIRTLIDSTNKYIFVQTVAIFLGSAIIFTALLFK